MKHDSLNDKPYYEEETYTKALSREDTIERQVRLCAFNYSNGNWDNFEYSLKILLSLLPKDVRNTFTPLKHDTTTKGIEDHYNMFVDIQRCLEDDTNMVFKKKFVKTYK